MKKYTPEYKRGKPCCVQKQNEIVLKKKKSRLKWAVEKGKTQGKTTVWSMLWDEVGVSTTKYEDAPQAELHREAQQA